MTGSDGPPVRWLLRGRVQGVGFRYFAQRRAQELGVTGWVRNLPDGGVEVQAAGDATALARFKEVLATGPPGSIVDELKEELLAQDPGWSRFEIRF